MHSPIKTLLYFPSIQHENVFFLSSEGINPPPSPFSPYGLLLLDELARHGAMSENGD